MRWPIRLQILLPFSGIILMLLLLVSGGNAYLASQFAKRAISHQLQGIVSTLRSTTFPLTEPVLRQSRGLSGAEFIVTDAGGHVEAATLKVGNSFQHVAKQRSESPLGASIALGGIRYFYQRVIRPDPIRSKETQIIHVLYPERNWRQARRDAILPPLYIGIFAMVVTVALALVIARRISLPIERLQHQVGRIAAGDNHCVTSAPSRNDELRDLALSINALATQLEQQARTIQRAERFALLGQVGAGLAHQLRNAITGARMAVQLHQETCSGNDAESLRVALFQLESTEQSLRQLLRAGQREPLVMTRRSVLPTIEHAIASVRPACDHQQVNVRFDLDDPQLDLNADHEQLQQALANLLHNAIQAAGKGGTVRLECKQLADNRIRFRVADTGPGVPRAIEERLFEPFVSSKPEGVGLGLVLAKRVAEQHGGVMRYFRTTETVFEIALPDGRQA